MFEEPIHITIPADARDPRVPFEAPPGVVVHRVPSLHPDDVTEGRGIPCTTVERTLIDLAEDTTEAELHELFARAVARGLVDPDAYRAARARVEWRPSLAMLDRVAAAFLP